MEFFYNTLLKTKIKMLEMHYKAKSGHIGGNISCLDAMMVLHHLIMVDDDQFVLSKGHSAGALYATLWSLGKLTDKDLNTFSQDNTLLPGHPCGQGIPGLLFSTGSLGHGPALASGLAIAARHVKSHRHIYCFCSDGEWQEGSCWESLIFASHQKLTNLTIMIDQNGFQGFGSTKDVASFDNIAKRLIPFGVNVIEVDGHDVSAIAQAFKNQDMDKLNVLVFNTIKGHGLHFENKLESHYLPLNESQYLDALQKLRGEM